MYTLIDLFRLAKENAVNINGKYIPARPMIGSLLFRVHDAWKVLKGGADAITWPGGQ